MKKILSLLMLTMFTVGVGWSTESVYKTLDFSSVTMSNYVNNYTSDFEATDGNFTWLVTHFNNGTSTSPWTIIRAGRKNDPSLASITTSSSVIDKAVTKVVVTVTQVNADKVNSAKLLVAPNADFTGNDLQTIELASLSVGENTYTITTPTENQYYELQYDMAADGGANGNLRISKVEYYAEDGGSGPAVATPVISGETPFLSSTEVTITCDTEGASIYYTIDGTEPTNESTAYTASFNLTESATVKAIAYDATGAASAVVSKSFVKTETINTIAAVNALALNTTFVFGGNAVVVYQKGTNLYIQDESAGTLVYGNVGVEYDQGDVLPVGWGGKKAVYNQCPEVASPTGFGSPSDNVELVAKELKTNAADLSVDFARYMVVKNATLEVVADSTFMTTADGTLKAFTKTFGITQVPEEGKTYNVYGVLGSYQGTPQLLPTKFEEYVEPVVEQTAAPVITYEETETAVIVTATGDGVVKLYADGVEVENPYVINRTEEDQVFVMSATAQEEGKAISETVTIEFVVTALVPVIPEYSEFYLVGTFSDPAWSQAEDARIPFTANDDASEYTANVTLAAGDQFKIITFDEEENLIWIGAESNGNFVILPGFYEDHINITLIFGDEGENFEIQEAGNYKITLKEAPSADGIAPKSLKAPLVMVVDKPTGIETINNSNVKSVRYYNLQGVESATPFQGVNIVVREMTDGSKIASKMVK